MTIGALIQIEPTTRCNLACRTRSREQGTKIIDISEKTLYAILGVHKSIHWIKLQGLGEPFMHPDFGKICEIASSYAPISTTTNGMFIDFNIVREMSNINISVDSIDPIYCKMLKGNNYNISKVLSNVLIASSLTETRITLVRSIHNLDHISGVQDFCDKNGLRLIINPVENWYAPRQDGYTRAHTEVIREREIFGKIPKRMGNCTWRNGHSYYYSADGTRRPCCIRMSYNGISDKECCATCPD